MPASDTWPCNVAIEPLVSMNSAGSSDSMVSTNSGFSDDSMEHLSAEERACLMFLEETIESLEAEDDSGISNDEYDRLNRSPLTKVAHPSPVSQTKQEVVPFHDDSNKVLGKDYKSNRLLVPTPLILANGSARILKKTAEVGTPEQKAVPLVNKPNDSPLNSHNPPAMLAADDDPAHSSLNPKPTADQSKELADLPPAFIPEPPVMADSSNNSKTKDGPAKTKLSPTPNQKHQSGTSEMVIELIPPPTDFMDEPKLPPPPQTQSPEQSESQPKIQAQAQQKAQPQAQVELQAQTQAQPKAQPQAQTQPNIQPQAEVQLQPQTQAQAQPKAQPQAQTQPNTQPQAEVQLQPQTQAQPKAQPQAQTQPNTQPQAEVQLQPQTQAQPKAQPQAQTQPNTQPQAEVQLQPQTQAQAQPKAQPQAQAQLQPQTQVQTHPKAQPQTQAQSKAQPQTQAQLQTQAMTQSQPQPQDQHKKQTQPQPLPPPESITIAPPPGFDGQAEDDKPQSAVTPPSRGSLSPSELDKLRKKASVKKAPGVAPDVSAQPPYQRISDQASFPVSCTDGRPITAVEHSEPKSPPAVAPKPKKLPSNITLKSHKDSGPGHSLVTPGERIMANPQKVHIEALKKLGLLKAGEIDSSPSLSSSPPHRITPPHPFNTSTSAVLPIGDTAQVQSTTAEQHSAGDMQIKANLSSLASPNLVKGGRESPVIQRGQSPKPFEIKSASLERPGVGLKSVTDDHSSHSTGQEKTNVELSPGQLRKSRPRPASAGSRKDFGIDQLPSDPSREPDVRRSLGSSPIPSSTPPSTDSQKTPRSHGMISVVFTPNSKNGEERKQALRKLGLIRD
ncbi:specifically androgen-regulated gene protein [Pygocentrus nattereri]|uniref:specifically androgen-regulated gene protein n=1 Tax=Pygocentrus nattereri TaxID=42514 RepID=UPI001891DEA2|nr:specifically androgen-regulated gene protein [Pygocentrus nattereri]XP_017573402.2 specifically androgen-regulated gene protein [Pygocentrus nattereri]